MKTDSTDKRIRRAASELVKVNMTAKRRSKRGYDVFVHRPGVMDEMKMPLHQCKTLKEAKAFLLAHIRCACKRVYQIKPRKEIDPPCQQ